MPMKTTFLFNQFKQFLHQQFGTTISYKRLKADFLTYPVDETTCEGVVCDQQLLLLMAWFLLHPELPDLRDWTLLRKLFFKYHGVELMKLLDDQYVDSIQLKRIPVINYLGLIDLFLALRRSDALPLVSYMQLARIIVRCFDVPYTVKGVRNTLCDRNTP